jgi:hypothetical protein
VSSGAVLRHSLFTVVTLGKEETIFAQPQVPGWRQTCTLWLISLVGSKPEPSGISFSFRGCVRDFAFSCCPFEYISIPTAHPLLPLCPQQGERGTEVETAAAHLLMGRKPNPLILEFFERGPKLDDSSNRYQHTCRACGEVFPKGRIDSLTTHLVRRCQSVSEKDRQHAAIQLQDSVIIEINDPIPPAFKQTQSQQPFQTTESNMIATHQQDQRTSLPGSPWSTASSPSISRATPVPAHSRLDTLAEVSRQAGPRPEYASTGEYRRPSEHSLPPDYAADYSHSPSPTLRGMSHMSLNPPAGQGSPSWPPALPAHSHHHHSQVRNDTTVRVSPSMPDLGSASNSPIQLHRNSSQQTLPRISMLSPVSSTPTTPWMETQDPMSFPRGDQRPVLPKPAIPLEPPMARPQLGGPSISDRYFRQNSRPPSEAMPYTGTRTIPGDGYYQHHHADPLNIDSSNGGALYENVPYDLRQSIMSPSFSTNGFHPRQNRKNVRARFTPSRRREVQEVRKRGACIRCRMLKKPVCERFADCCCCKPFTLYFSLLPS